MSSKRSASKRSASKRSTYASKRSASAAELDELYDWDNDDDDDDDDIAHNQDVGEADIEEYVLTWWVVSSYFDQEVGEWQYEWWRAWPELREDGSMVWVVG
jgi:hypothetical protein